MMRILALLFIPFMAFAAGPEPVRVQIGGEPSTLDPSRVIDQYGFGILRNVVEGLYRLDGEGQLQPGLAASHTVSKDGLTYKFKLRPDAKWSDGKAVTADDFIYALRRGLDPRTAPPNAKFYFAIKNAKEIFAGKMKPESLGISGIGDELAIQLERPDPALLMSLALPPAAPLRKDVFEANKGQWKHDFPVTGDYVIKSYRPAEMIELAPNPVRAKPEQRPIQYRILQEETTAMNLLESGRMDVITTITPTEIERLKKRGYVKIFPSTTVFYFSFNLSKPPFNDADWRKAIASSVDRAGLAKALSGAFEPMTSYLPPAIEGSLPAKDLAFPEAVEKIKKLAKKPHIRLAYGSSAFTKTVAEKFQHDMQRKLGVQVTLEPMELKTLLARLKTDPPEMHFLGMSALFNDPLNHLNGFSSDGGQNFARYSSSDFEKAIEGVRTTPKGSKRTELSRQANSLLVEKDVIVVPMVLRMQIFGVSPSLKGFQVDPYQVIQLSRLEK